LVWTIEGLVSPCVQLVLLMHFLVRTLVGLVSPTVGMLSPLKHLLIRTLVGVVSPTFWTNPGKEMSLAKAIGKTKRKRTKNKGCKERVVHEYVLDESSATLNVCSEEPLLLSLVDRIDVESLDDVADECVSVVDGNVAIDEDGPFALPVIIAKRKRRHELLIQRRHEVAQFAEVAVSAKHFIQVCQIGEQAVVRSSRLELISSCNLFEISVCECLCSHVVGHYHVHKTDTWPVIVQGKCIGCVGLCVMP
jgi:hypothetical protein